MQAHRFKIGGPPILEESPTSKKIGLGIMFSGCLGGVVSGAVFFYSERDTETGNTGRERERESWSKGQPVTSCGASVIR